MLTNRFGRRVPSGSAVAPGPRPSHGTPALRCSGDVQPHPHPLRKQVHPALPEKPRGVRDAARQRPHRRRIGEWWLLQDHFTVAGRSHRSLHRQLLVFPGDRPAAPMAGARVSHRPMVTTIEVR